MCHKPHEKVARRNSKLQQIFKKAVVMTREGQAKPQQQQWQTTIPVAVVVMVAVVMGPGPVVVVPVRVVLALKPTAAWSATTPKAGLAPSAATRMAAGCCAAPVTACQTPSPLLLDKADSLHGLRMVSS